MQRLSPYQAKIGKLIALGYSNRDIATELETSEQAVKSAIHTIFDKLGVGNRVELVTRLAEGSPDLDKAALLRRVEQSRLVALKRALGNASEREEELDDVVHVAATLCETPIALLTIVEADRIWAKSAFGMKAREVARCGTICDLTIQGSGLVQVKDVTQDERFADQFYARLVPRVSFYAAVPLLTPDGYALGTLCVLDLSPRELTSAQQEGLTRLARVAQSLLLRKAQRVLDSRSKGSSKRETSRNSPSRTGVTSRRRKK